MIANRTARVLLSIPGSKSRMFARTTPGQTAELFAGMSLTSGETLELQRYDPYLTPKHPGLGWVTTKRKAS
jgi:hypothetical protein